MVVKNWTKQCEQSLMQGHELIYLEADNTNSIGPEVLADGFWAGLMECSCS